MKTLFNLATIVILITSSSGCSKLREFTRRDYSLMRDPFANDSKLADKDVSPAGSKPSTSGFARIGDTHPQQQGIQAQTVARSTPAAPKTAQSVSAPAEGVAQLDDAQAAFVKATQVAEGTASSAQATADAEISGFYDWAAEERESWEDSTPGSRAPATDETASPLILTGGNSAPLASTSANEAAIPLIERPVARTESQPPAAQSAGTTAAGWPELPANAVPAPESSTAATRPTVDASPISSANPFADISAMPSAATIMPTPRPVFDGPSDRFETTQTLPSRGTPAAASIPEFDTQPRPANPVQPVSTARTLDAGFHFDEGWKPADVEMP